MSLDGEFHLVEADMASQTRVVSREAGIRAGNILGWDNTGRLLTLSHNGFVSEAQETDLVWLDLETTEVSEVTSP